MREILFRGKRIDNGKWRIGFYCQVADESDGGARVKHVIVVPTFKTQTGFLVYEVIPSTVGQYTGKTDKHKVKIFEDDIIRANNDGAVGVIRFGEAIGIYPEVCHVGFYVSWQGENKDYLRADLGYWVSRRDVEVVGNIHDNPELLKSRS